MDPFPLDALFRAHGGRFDKRQRASLWDPDILTATGKQISNVASVYLISFEDNTSIVQLAITITGCRKELERLGLQLFDDPLAHTLIAGTNAKREASSIAGVQAYLNLLQIETAEQADYTKDSGASSESLLAYEQAARKAGSNRRLFTTEHGQIGLDPPDTRQSDVVAIIFGAEWPVVLRRLGQEGWSFVGQCYTHGIMYGEAVRDDRF